jgi:hypothetical protein
MRYTLAAAALLALTAGHANAEEACAASDVVRKHLASKYEEAPVGLGISDGVLFEVWSSESKGTWTIIATSPQGKSCVIGAGTGWQSAKPVVGDPA